MHLLLPSLIDGVCRSARQVRTRVKAALIWVSLLVAVGPGCVSSGPDAYARRFHERAIDTGVAAPSVDFTDPLLRQRQVWLVGEINELTARRTLLGLAYLETQAWTPVDLFLDTSGGEFEQAFAIIDFMRSMRSPVNTRAIGRCNSAGTFILAAGTGRRLAYTNANLVLHGVQAHGKLPPGMRESVCSRAEGILRQHARLPESWYPLTPASLRYLTAQQALEFGLIDEIVAPSDTRRTVTDKVNSGRR